MRIRTAALAIALACAPMLAHAHGVKPQAAHGGEVQDAQGVWVELVIKDGNVVVYVVTEDHKPIPAAQISGTVTVLVEGKAHKVDLGAGKDNSVQGKLPVAAVGKVVATVALKVGEKTASARFAGNS